MAKKRLKHSDLPAELREANSEYQRLQRAGKPVPEDIRALKCEYLRITARRRDPKVGSRRRGRQPEYDDIPEELREANSEYQRLRRAGQPIPENIHALNREYNRILARHRDPKVGSRRRGRQPEHEDIPEKLRAANSEYQRRLRAGQPIPESLRIDARAYNNMMRKRQLSETAENQPPASPKTL